MEDTLHQEPDTSAAEIAAGLSTLDKIKRRRAARDLGHEFFDIPTWGGELKARAQVLERRDIDDMIRRVRARQVARGAKGNAAGQRREDEIEGNNADLDFIIKAVDGIKAVDMETGDEEMLPFTSFTKDWEQLKQMLDDPEMEEEKRKQLEFVSGPREMVAYMIGNQTIAIGAFSGKLARWMQDTSKIEDPS